MPQLLNIEEEDRGLPIICIFGEYSPLLQTFIEENYEKFRIVFISSKKPQILSLKPEIYFLTYTEAQVLPKLKETIDYSLILLSNIEQKEYLSPVVEKLKQDKAKTLLTLEALSFIQNVDVLLDLKENSHFHLSILGELLTRKKLETKGELSKIIKNAIQNGEIRLTGNDLTPVYPITISDAIRAIQRLLFGKFKTDTLFYLFYKHPETALSTAHIIGRIEPEIKIVFSEEGNTLRNTISREEMEKVVKEKLRLKEEYMENSFEGFEKGFEEIFKNESAPLENESISTFQDIKEPEEEKGFHFRGFMFKSLIAGFVLFLLTNVAFLALGLFYLKLSIDGIKNEDYSKVSLNASTSRFFLSAVKPTAYTIFDGLKFFDKEGKLMDTFSLMENGARLSEIASETITNISKKPELSSQSLQTAIANFVYLYQEGERITLTQNNEALKSLLNPQYSKLLSLSQVLPEVLGYNTEKNYLLLFQNDNELRPTGGFIGSIGELSLKNGEINSLNILDVYDLDGQLKEHVEPPFVVRRYLQPHLYLRDSNFSLDFQQSASTSAKIYNLESGKKPDGVIAINLEVLKQILKILGPISLPEYKVTVTDKNVSDFLEHTIEDNNFPGSTQKKDILNKLLNKLILKASSNPHNYIEIAKLLPNLMDEKDILFSFEDPSIQAIFNADDYGGQIKDTREKRNNTAYDYLYVNEANIGVNKANADITRTVDYQTVLNPDRIDSSLNLQITNTSTTDGYKAYLQIVVPKGSKLQSITIDNAKQTIVPAVTDPQKYEAKNFKAPKGLEVESYDKDDHTIFAFIITVPKSEKSTILVSYENGIKLPSSTVSKYSLLYIKQPGTMPYRLNTTIFYPEGYSPINTNANSYGKNFLTQEQTITKDFQTSVQLQKDSVQK